MMVIAVLLAIVSTLSAPLFARARNGIVLAALAIVCAIVAILQPSFTPERPRHLSLAYVDDPAARSPQWIVGTLTAPLRKAAPFQPGDASLTPWSRGVGFAAPAPNAQLPRVSMAAEKTNGGFRIHVRTSRRANRVALLVRGAKVLRVNGVTPPPRPARFRERSGDEWQSAIAYGVEEMVVDVAATGRVDAVASDTSFTFPAIGASLVRARNASTAIPVHDGDITITRTRATLQ